MGKGLCAASLGIAAMLLPAAQVPNLTGTWKLNLQKSHWGKKEKPASILLHIRHNEPNIVIDGSVVDAKEQSDDFHYEGTTDGKMHTAPSGTLSIRRIGPYALESVWRSHDGRFEQTSRTTVSKDGNELRREVELKRPDAHLKWTEVYDRAG